MASHCRERLELALAVHRNSLVRNIGECLGVPYDVPGSVQSYLKCIVLT